MKITVLYNSHLNNILVWDNSSFNQNSLSWRASPPWTPWSWTVMASVVATTSWSTTVKTKLNTFSYFNTSNEELFCMNNGDQRFFLQFEIITNVLVSSFFFILIPMSWVYANYKYFNFFSLGTIFIIQNLMSITAIRLWRIKTVLALKGYPPSHRPEIKNATKIKALFLIKVAYQNCIFRCTNQTLRLFGLWVVPISWQLIREIWKLCGIGSSVLKLEESMLTLKHYTVHGHRNTIFPKFTYKVTYIYIYRPQIRMKGIIINIMSQALS